MSTIGSRIREARKVIGLQQKELAKKIGIKNDVLSNWERDVNKPYADKMILLCQALNIKLSYLLDYYEPETSDPAVTGEERDPEYTRKYNSLDKEARRRVKNALDYEYAMLLKKERITLIAPYMSICKGYCNFLDNSIVHKTIEVLKNKYTYGATHVINLSGDSMEPEFHDGDRLIVTQTNGEAPINGRIGIFIVNNEAFLRQLLDGVLHPYNPNYPDITPGEYDNINYAGYVVGILDDSWIIE